jgi:hypothetical protein
MVKQTTKCKIKYDIITLNAGFINASPITICSNHQHSSNPVFTYMNSTGCIEETSIQKLVLLVPEYLALQYANQLEVKYKINSKSVTLPTPTSLNM